MTAAELATIRAALDAHVCGARMWPAHHRHRFAAVYCWDFAGARLRGYKPAAHDIRVEVFRYGRGWRVWRATTTGPRRSWWRTSGRRSRCWSRTSGGWSVGDERIVHVWSSKCGDCGFVSGLAEVSWPDGTRKLLTGAGCRTRRGPGEARRWAAEVPRG